MSRIIYLDASPLGLLAHPRPTAEIAAWLFQLMNARVQVVVPEVTDFEVRRNLVLHQRTASLAELDRLKLDLSYAPITTAAMLRAASLWADVRRRGRPTADPRELDCDVILAAQALEVGAVVATANVGHLSRYVTAQDWRTIAPSPKAPRRKCATLTSMPISPRLLGAANAVNSLVTQKSCGERQPSMDSRRKCGTFARSGEPDGEGETETAPGRFRIAPGNARCGGAEGPVRYL